MPRRLRSKGHRSIHLRHGGSEKVYEVPMLADPLNADRACVEMAENVVVGDSIQNIKFDVVVLDLAIHAHKMSLNGGAVTLAISLRDNPLNFTVTNPCSRIFLTTI